MTHPDLRRSAFISYRRTSSFAALHIRDALRRHNIDAFLDEDISAGSFPNAIFAEIIRRPYFLVLLAPGTLDGVSRHDDWLRIEILHALAHQRAIIPLLINGFQFAPDVYLPPEIERLRTFQALPVPNRFVDEAIKKLCVEILKLDVPGGHALRAPGPLPRSPERQHVAAPRPAGQVAAESPRPSDHLTRGEKNKLRDALLARLADEDPLRWSAVESVLFNVVRRVYEPDWRGPQGVRAIIEQSCTKFFLADIGISAPFDAEQAAEREGARKPQDAKSSKARVAEAPSTTAQPAKTPAPRTSSAKTPISRADEPKVRPANASTPKPRTAKPQGVPAAAPVKATERKTTGSPSARSQAGKRPARPPQPEAPHPDDVRRVSYAMLAEFTLTNPLTLDAVADIVKNKAPRLHGLTLGSKRRLAEVLRSSFSPVEVFEVESGRHLVYRDAGITDHELEQAWVALDAELTRNGSLRLDAAGPVLLDAMPRISTPEWAGDGSLSEFLRMRFPEDFKIDNRPDGRYVIRVRNGFLDRFGWRRRHDMAR